VQRVDKLRIPIGHYIAIVIGLCVSAVPIVHSYLTGVWQLDEVASGTSVLATVRARRGQGLFKQRVMEIETHCRISEKLQAAIGSIPLNRLGVFIYPRKRSWFLGKTSPNRSGSLIYAESSPSVFLLSPQD
jgi:hypothetical protein